MIQKQDIISYLSTNKVFFYKEFGIKKIGIFGSFARDEQTEKSDIDIIIDMEDKTEDMFYKRMALKELISKHFSVPVDVCHKKAIKPIFKQAILKDVIYV